ncbi:retrovirus-related pol polyprotein from transposon TNT 1-94 [Tanacetum coccineum]|uniref:Retrovirus-related pol polyprotein from transposon TNT 1-94 n=1 Tax=Tanacetum coccineum TaxID=301880 RepID=A0ABQ4XNB9_9ASTR
MELGLTEAETRSLYLYWALVLPVQQVAASQNIDLMLLPNGLVSYVIQLVILAPTITRGVVSVSRLEIDNEICSMILRIGWEFSFKNVFYILMLFLVCIKNLEQKIDEELKRILFFRFEWRRMDGRVPSKDHCNVPATESEYIAASEAAMEAVWIRKFISGLGIVPTINEPLNMYCDNSAAVHYANEPGVQKGARHYQRRYHYVRECVELGEIRILKVHTDNNLADPFTKALSNRKLTQHARGMGLRPASSFIFDVVTKSPISYSFTIDIKADLRLLSPPSTYSCYLIYKLSENDKYSSFEGPMVIGIIDGTRSHVRPLSICLNTNCRTPFIGVKDDGKSSMALDTCKMKGHPKLRKDGWMEVQLAEVVICTTGATKEIFTLSLEEEKFRNTIFVDIAIQGIEFRPL